MKIKGICNKIVSWIKKYVKAAKKKGVVIGLSGGVDSSVVCSLCIKALGRRNVLALVLPFKGDDKELSDAIYVAKYLNANYKVINLTDVYELLLSCLPKADKITKGNLKARLRMVTLYYFANKLNYLVAGTGNKSELSIGYFTKYGDGGVDFSPIGDLYKSEVRELAKYLGIPARIINKVPTAGLWRGQTDEGELGISYEELEKMLESGKLSKKVEMMVKTAKHKISPPPVFKIHTIQKEW